MSGLPGPAIFHPGHARPVKIDPRSVPGCVPSLSGDRECTNFFAPGPILFFAFLRSSSKATPMEQGHAKMFSPRCIDIPESNCYTPCFKGSVIRAICSCISCRVTPSGTSTIRQIINCYLLTLLRHALECFLDHLQPLRTILPC